MFQKDTLQSCAMCCARIVVVIPEVSGFLCVSPTVHCQNTVSSICVTTKRKDRRKAKEKTRKDRFKFQPSVFQRSGKKDERLKKILHKMCLNSYGYIHLSECTDLEIGSHVHK